MIAANSSGSQKYLNSAKLNLAVQKALRSMNAGRRIPLSPKLTRGWQTQILYEPRKLRQLFETKTYIRPKTWDKIASELPYIPPDETPPRCATAAEIWFTDGYKNHAQADGFLEVIGAGVCCSNSGVSLKVDPMGYGSTNTITIIRAELVAIAVAYTQMGLTRDEIIATDSQACICLIAKVLDCPNSLTECKHQKLLQYVLLYTSASCC